MVHLHLIAHFKPQGEKWSLSQSLNFYVAVSAHFLESKDPVLKILRGRIQGQVCFPVFLILSQIYIDTLFHILLFL